MSYDYSVFNDGSRISNILLVLHLEQVYDLLGTWEGKGLLFFCLHLVKFGLVPEALDADLAEYYRILRNVKLIERTRSQKPKFVIVKSFADTLKAVDEQNSLYDKLLENIVRQKKFPHKLVVTLDQYNSFTGEIYSPFKKSDEDGGELPPSIDGFLRSL
jgi:hypothetical protein